MGELTEQLASYHPDHVTWLSPHQVGELTEQLAVLTERLGAGGEESAALALQGAP